jgi:hypothetical protein
MGNKHFNYYVKAQFDGSTTVNDSDFTVSDIATASSFSSVVNTTVGQEDTFTYSLLSAGNTAKWEFGIGTMTTVSSTTYIFKRIQVLSSSRGSDQKELFVSGDGILTIEMVMQNPNYSSSESISSDTNIDNLSSNYLINAQNDIVLSLPGISKDSSQIGFTITSLSGVETQRVNAVTINASGTNTIAGTGSYVLDVKNDFVQFISDTGTNNWVPLNIIASGGGSEGPNGAVQLADNSELGYNTGLFFSNDSLFIGGQDLTNSTIKLSANGNTIFNVKSGALDFIVRSLSQDYTFLVDASQNNIGINTSSPTGLVNINVTSSGSEGLVISTATSGGIPLLHFKNFAPDFSNGVDIGRVDFSAQNSVGETIDYARILSESYDNTDSSEEGSMRLMVNHNGVLQSVADLKYDSLEIGPNNLASGGLIIGSNNTNEGDNIVIGYYGTNCGTSSINVGHHNTIHSGSYGGVVGTNHTVSGSNVWVFGGSGFSVTETNSTYLVGNSNNYIKIDTDLQDRAAVYVNSTGTDFNIVNTRVSTPGIEHKQSILFNNSIGETVTGVSYGVLINNATDGAEDTSFSVRVLENGSSVDVMKMGGNLVNISDAADVDGSVMIGRNLTISGAGTNITVIGSSGTITANSGEITMIGHNNFIEESGNDHIVVVGNTNTVNDNYATVVGTLNSNSGIYSAMVGYNNGSYGENISIIGVNNDISGNNSAVIGYQNNIDNNHNYMIGQGNTSTYSGVVVLGNNVTASSHNTTYIKNDTVSITGGQISFDTTGVINFNSPELQVSGNKVVVSGDNVSLLNNDSAYVASGNNISLLVNDSNYVVSGSDYNIESGSNVSLLTNDSNYVASGNNVSILTNDANYLTSSSFANPKLTFSVSATGANAFIFSGAGTQGAGIDENPTLYLYKGFTYDFDINASSSHPLNIKLGSSLYTSGVTNNVGVHSGVVSWNVRHDTIDSGIYYICSNHTVMSGDIIIV